MRFSRLGNGALKDKGSIDRLQLAPGWALFQPNQKNPPAPPGAPPR
jgi:hypothetical protein